MWLFPHINQFSDSLYTKCPKIKFNADTTYPELVQNSQGLGVSPTSDTSHKSQVATCMAADQPAIYQVPTTSYSGLIICLLNGSENSRKQFT